MSRLVLGIDEAGRGPALGAMVVAAVALEPSASRRLTRAGVSDSKKFGSGEEAHAIRSELAVMIRQHASFFSLEVCDVATIDAYVSRGALNVLERERAEILVRLAPPCRRIVADGKHLFGALRAAFPHLEAADRGEDKHVAVAAASILAKVRRDDLFSEIAARYHVDFGPIAGGGYVNARTRAFTDAYRARFGALPPEARTSWPWRPLRGPSEPLGAKADDRDRKGSGRAKSPSKLGLARSNRMPRPTAAVAAGDEAGDEAGSATTV